MGCQSAEVHENFDVAPGPGTIARTTKHPNLIIVDENRLLQNKKKLPLNKKCLKNMIVLTIFFLCVHKSLL